MTMDNSHTQESTSNLHNSMEAINNRCNEYLDSYYSLLEIISEVTVDINNICSTMNCPRTYWDDVWGINELGKVLPTLEVITKDTNLTFSTYNNNVNKYIECHICDINILNLSVRLCNIYNGNISKNRYSIISIAMSVKNKTHIRITDALEAIKSTNTLPW